MPSCQNFLIVTGMTLRRADVANPAMAMIEVVPMHELVAQERACSRSAKPLAGNSGRYFAVRNSDSANALSSLTRGREYDGFTPPASE